MSHVAAECPPPSDQQALPGNILIHHTRDTAEKQWAETCVLTLAGVSRVFSTRSHILQKLDDYPRAFALLLEMIEASALNKNSEVALNSLKSFQEIVNSENKLYDDKGSQKPTISFLNINENELDLWTNAWRVWQNIGAKSMESAHFIRTSKDSNGKIETKTVYPSQPFLTALVNIFPPLLTRIHTRFGIGDLQRLCNVLLRAVTMPLHSDTSPFLLPTFHHDAVLSPLQQSVLTAIRMLLKETPLLDGKHLLDYNENQPMFPTLFNLLLTFVEYACCPPKVDSGEGGENKDNFSHVRGRAGEWIVMNYVPLAEASMAMVQELYKESFAKDTVVQENVLQKIIQVSASPPPKIYLYILGC